MKRLKAILMAGIDILIPPACLVCHTRLGAAQKSLCPQCESQISFVKENFCYKCGSELTEGYCETCHQTEFKFELSRSSMHYQTPLTELMHLLKYSGYRSPAAFMAEKMAESLKEYPEFEDYPYITAVPLHRVRRRERGYNQSELIAKKLAKLCGKTYIRPVLRSRYTLSQTTLHRTERLSNLAGAFRVRRGNQVQGKKLILVDDVFTTGSTLNEISGELYKAGAVSVAGFTATRA
ncbi:MAG: ComF family protein [Candidatus Cloacimonetes bacterium]|nr:ComF family protein [Candidatus Cloacimonadota bacterium]MCB5286413.1 ComF family protein [Candidatus Cloacimonadota bacterium]MCK9184240.1 ComF family protein [Candidatus Cloacimonadota bacterium]MCK9583385.1 ComF family protein [Candidatus Cloacimonadota bacterium]MDY0228735.1 ComF family protein [Candidatus Cloacimonadaceae bacterium]